MNINLNTIGKNYNIFTHKKTSNNQIGLLKNNLAPLEQDTVSFSGLFTKKPEVLATSSKKMDKSDRPNLAVATKIYQESEEPFDQFKYVLSQIFNCPVIELGKANYKERINSSIIKNQKSPIIMITARRKTPSSIAEKMATLKVNSASDTKDKIYDIIGARIVLSGNSQKEGDYVLSKITDGVKANKLKIREVKVHGQDNAKLQYASNRKLNSLITACSKKNSAFTYKNQPRDSGYLAIHLIADGLPNGYKGEIQIMGLEVAKFKEIEDLCYKCHSGKELPEKYRELKKCFIPLTKDKKMMEQYLEYTKRAYKYERLKTEHKKGMYEEFLSIPADLKLIPRNLDFNEIAKMKIKIDSR